MLIAPLDVPSPAGTRLAALMALRDLLDSDELAAAALRATDNAQRALCCMQWGHSADVEKRAEDMDVQMLAAEIEKRCFSSGLSPDDIRPMGDISVEFPLGATFAAAE